MRWACASARTRRKIVRDSGPILWASGRMFTAACRAPIAPEIERWFRLLPSCECSAKCHMFGARLQQSRRCSASPRPGSGHRAFCGPTRSTPCGAVGNPGPSRMHGIEVFGLHPIAASWSCALTLERNIVLATRASRWSIPVPRPDSRGAEFAQAKSDTQMSFIRGSAASASNMTAA